jgi:hypothetical protein
MTQTLNAAAIVDVLNRHGVRFIVIGAFAAIAQHAPIPATRDIDLTPDSSAENLGHLSTALKELGARIRTDEVIEGLPFEHDGRSLGALSVWNLICPLVSSTSHSCRVGSQADTKSSPEKLIQ